MDAVGLIKRARQERRSLYELLRQPDLQTGQPPSESVQALVKLFYQGEYLTRPVAKDKVAAKLKAFVDPAMQTKPEPGIFGDAPSALDNLQSITQPAEDQPGVSEEESVYKVRQPDGPDQALAGFDLSPESVTADLFPDSLSGQQDLPTTTQGAMKRSVRQRKNDQSSTSRQTKTDNNDNSNNSVDSSTEPRLGGEPRLSLRPAPLS